jgi:transposase
MAAQTLVRSHAALGSFYRRLQARLGAPKAITATAHKLARIFYHFWKLGGTYIDPGMNAYERQHQERVIKHLQKKAQALGFDLIAQPILQECVS